MTEPIKKHLWMVEDREAKSFWTRVGHATENRDGSWSLHLSAIPVTGRLQMRDAKRDARFKEDAVALDQIADCLRAPDWNADTLDAIADIVRATGRKVED